MLLERVRQESSPKESRTYIFTMHRKQLRKIWEKKKLEISECATEKEIPEQQDDPDWNASAREDVISHMAYVCATWKIAYMRFVDNVPQEIRYHLLVRFVDQIWDSFMGAWAALSTEEQLTLLDTSPADKKQLEEAKTRHTELEGLRKVRAG